MANVDRLETIAQQLETKAGITAPLSGRRDATAEAKLRRIAVAVAALELADSDAITDAPSDGGTYARKDGAWVAGIEEAPVDGAQYARQDGAWATVVTSSAATVAWGDISGTLANQTDVQAALDAKAASSHSHTEADITDLGTYIEVGSSITKLGDVGGSTPTSGQVPTYNSTNAQYEPATPSAGGGGGSFALKWETIQGRQAYSANGPVISVSMPANTVENGDFIRITCGGRGGTGQSGGQNIRLDLPGQTEVHDIFPVSLSGRDWWGEIMIECIDVTASPPTFRLHWSYIEHEGAEITLGDQSLDSASWTGTVANIDFESTGNIGLSVADYVSGGGWVSFFHCQVLQGGTFDGT